MEPTQYRETFNDAIGTENCFQEEEIYRYFLQPFQSSKTLEGVSYRLEVLNLNLWS